MRHPEVDRILLVGVFVAATSFCVGGAAGALLQSKATPHEPQAEEPSPVVEVYTPEPWKGRVECTYGNSMLYSVGSLVDFIVTAQPGGWMWEMFKEDGTVVLYQQPTRTFCSAIPDSV